MKKCLEMIKNMNKQRAVIALCIMMTCISTQQIQTTAWNSGHVDFFTDLLGVLMAVVIASNYKWQDCKAKPIPYLVWSVIGVVGAGFLPGVIRNREPYLLADTIIIYLGLVLMGFCVIHTVLDFISERKKKKELSREQGKLPRTFSNLFWVCVLLLVCALISKTDLLWPGVYGVLFGCFYLTRQTKVQRENTLLGICDGLILGFLVIQGHSLLTRPYDIDRYCGNFCNPNNNAIFLCFCLAAIYAKLLYLKVLATKAPSERVSLADKKVDKKNLLWSIVMFLMAEVCLSFIFMTISRSGYVTVIVLTLTFLCMYCKVSGKKVFLQGGILLAVVFVAVMPMTYLAVRYIPTIHPHVNFYFQEGYSEDRVHSFDDRNSEKFISFTEMLGAVFGRFEKTKEDLSERDAALTEEGTDKVIYKGLEHGLYQVLSSSDQVDTSVVEINPNKIPVLTMEEGESGYLVRYNIYKWYIEHLSLRGMPSSEQGFQMTPIYWIGHPHDIFLYYGINFGIPAMIFFAVMVLGAILHMWNLSRKKADMKYMIAGLLLPVAPVFGIFEFAWGTGMVASVILYLALKESFLQESFLKDQTQ